MLTQFVLSARGLADATSPTAMPIDFAIAAVGGGQGAGSYHLHPGIFEEGSQGSVGHVPSLAGSSSVWERLSSRHPAAKRGGGAVGAGGGKRVQRGEDLFEGACRLVRHAPATTGAAAPLPPPPKKARRFPSGS